MKNRQVVELAIGKVKEGVSRDRYLQAAIAVEPDLRKMSGFQKRALCAGEDRLWVDRVWWNSPADMNQAHEAFQYLESGKQMESLLDSQTVQIYQLELVYEDHFQGTAKGNYPVNGQPVVELVMSRLMEGVSQEAYLQVAAAVEPDLRKMSGFLSRQLLLDQSGLWIDIVYWNSMEEALAAAEGFMKLESAKPVNAMLDVETLRILHLELVYEDTVGEGISAA